MPKYDLLAGVRVLDLGQALAGNFGSQILADLGAEVIKIETPGPGDQTRDTVPQLGNDGYYFLALNRNKKSVVLDLQTESGKKAFLDLVKISDVVYTNLRAKAQEHLGITYEQLKEINPRIICCSITAFGKGGPYQDWPAFDDVIQAMSGISSLTTASDGTPVRTAVASADISASVFAVIGIVGALYKRKETGNGMEVELNMLGSSMAFIQQLFQYYFLTGNFPRMGGAKHPAIATFGFFRTRNGYIALGPCWSRITRVINKEELVDDPRFKEPEQRFLHKDELNAEIEAFFIQHDTEDLMNILRAEDIPAGPVQDLKQVETDPQTNIDKMIRKIVDPIRGEVRVIDCPIKIQGLKEEEHSVPPLLGQHTDEVLKELLNYSEEEIMRLKKESEAHLEELLRTSVRRRL